MVAMILGMVVATALVSGYVNRPSTCSRIAVAAEGNCPACPAEGTNSCPKESGICPAQTGDCPQDACCAGRAAPTCPAAAMMGQKVEGTGANCPVRAAMTTGECGAGQCPRTN